MSFANVSIITIRLRQHIDGWIILVLQLARNDGALLPLPEGEGRGEGEGTCQTLLHRNDSGQCSRPHLRLELPPQNCHHNKRWREW
jgi:hypothetical protein